MSKSQTISFIIKNFSKNLYIYNSILLIIISGKFKEFLMNIHESSAGPLLVTQFKIANITEKKLKTSGEASGKLFKSSKKPKGQEYNP